MYLRMLSDPTGCLDAGIGSAIPWEVSFVWEAEPVATGGVTDVCDFIAKDGMEGGEAEGR